MVTGAQGGGLPPLSSRRRLGEGLPLALLLQLALPLSLLLLLPLRSWPKTTLWRPRRASTACIVAAKLCGTTSTTSSWVVASGACVVGSLMRGEREERAERRARRVGTW